MANRTTTSPSAARQKARSTDTQRVRIALVEDHGATRAEQCAALKEHDDKVELVAAVANAESLLRIADASIDVALVDLQLPGMDGRALIQELAYKAPNIRCLVLTTFDDAPTIGDAIRAGAVGYLLKDEPTVRLVQAIEEAARSEHPISSRVAGVLFDELRSAPPPVTLSDREEELAHALAGGLSYADCAERMGIAIGTVQDYVKRVYRKLDINTKKELRAWVSRYPRRS